MKTATVSAIKLFRKDLDATLQQMKDLKIEIIGEALNQMLKLEPGMASIISDHKRIIAFRNRLIHGYADIAHDVVWGVLETSLPQLHREVGEILEREDES